jgi:hypothetical protein
VTPLVAPSGFTATARTASTVVDFTWADNSANESGYKVERSTDNVTFIQIQTTGPDATAYSDATVAQGTVYYYRVRAYNAVANSSYTASANVTTALFAPSSLSASAASATTINLTWTDNSTTESGFKVERSTDNVTFTPIGTAAAGATTYSDTTAADGTTYYYRVRGYNAATNSPYSGGANATTPLATPTAVAASAAYPTRINLTWTDNSLNESGYRVERSTDNANFVEIATTAANVASYSDLSVVEGTTYYYRVRAYNAVATSAYGSTASAVTPLVAPSALAATARPDTAVVDLMWADNSLNETGYRVERSADNVNFTEIGTTAASITSYSDAAAAQGTRYYYRVRAYNAVAYSAYTASASATTVLFAPTSLAASAASATRINLTWTDNATTESGYRIERSTDNVTFTEIGTASANAITYGDTTASDGTTYYYRVRAYNAATTSLYSGPANATTPLATPSTLVATAASPTRINLAWADNSLNETGYSVERSTDTVNYFEIGTTGQNVTSYSDLAAVEGTTYYYRVRAYNAVTTSAYSNAPSTVTPLVAPSAFTAAARPAVTVVDLAWSDNSVNESGYKVERSTDNITFTQIGTTAANATAYSDATVAQGTVYYYRVRAYNAVANSAYTASANTTTVLFAPSSLAASAATPTKINLAWADNAVNESGYKVERSTDNVTFTQIATTGANATSYSDNTAADGITYCYRVRAYNAATNSPYSDPSAATTPLATPTVLAASAASPTRVNLNWTDNSANESGYKIERSTDNITFVGIATTAANAASYSDPTVAEGITYYFRVRAYNAATTSAYGNVASAVTPLVAPSGLAAVARPDTAAVDLSWADNSANESGYRIERSTDNVTFAEIGTTAANATSFSDSAVAQGTRYYYRVRAYNAVAFSGYTAAANATTVLLPPSALAASAVSPTTINLSWADNSTTESGFRIERSTDNLNFADIGTAGANATSYGDATASDGTTYFYRVRAYNSATTSAYSASANGMTPLATPTALLATAMGPNSVNLTWTDNAANETGYRVERSTDYVTFAQIATAAANASSYTDATAAEGTTYYYRVRTYNAAANSGYSGASGAVTPLVAPSGFTATARPSAAVVDLAWADNSANESGYQVERSTDNVTFTQIGTTGQNATAYSDATAAQATTYYYRVRAYNAVAVSSYAASAGATTAVLAPAAPSSVSAVAASATSVNLSWVDNASNESGFRVERSTDNISFVEIGTAAADVTTYGDNSAADGTSYFYRLRAYNAGGASAYSDVAAVTTPLPAPSLLAAAPVSPSRVDLSWQDNSTSESGFRVERSTDGVSFAEIGTAGRDVANSSDNVAAAGATYFYRVRAYNVAGTSAYSDVARADTPAVSVTAASFVGSDVTTKGSWQGVYGGDGYTLAGDATSLPAYAQFSLSGNQQYVWAPSTSDVRAEQKASGADRMAGCWYVVGPGSAFTFDLNLSDGRAHRVSLYALDWENAGRVERIDVVDADTGTVLDNRGLSAFSGGTWLSWNVVGHVKLRVVNVAGYTAVVSGLTLDTPASAPPAAPSALSAAAASSVTVTLTWNDNASDEGGFRIERSTDNSNFSEIGATGANAIAFTDDTASPATTYYYRVRAFNAAGASAYSNTASATTLPGSGAAAAFAGSDGNTQGSWRGVYGADGYALAGDATSLPSYAQVSLAGQNDYTWASSTSDVRALQRPGSGDRIASCWYSWGSFTIDVNLVDGQAHQVGLYVLDWDNYNRTEKFDVIDADTGAVLDTRTIADFVGGQYLSWNVSGHVQIRVTNLASNAVVGGLFFDGPA